MATRQYNPHDRGGQRPNYGNRGHNPQNEVLPEFDSSWITNGINAKAIAYAEKHGEFCAKNNLTTSQIRNVFSEMRRIQANDLNKQATVSSYLMLLPKLAYAVKRHNTSGLTKFYDEFKLAYSALDISNENNRGQQYENMMSLYEAILAYHKYHGGRE